jgi:DNA-binding GntR family transcriptional regulator
VTEMSLPQRDTLLRPNLKEAVAARIRELIFSGRLRPGTKIDQDELADELGVSKLPVREALITLESEALVRNIPRRGAFVAHLSRVDVMDHYNVFGMVSGLAAERAATALSDDELADVVELNDRMRASSSATEQEELNFRFHRAINRASGSRRLRSVLLLLGQSLPARFFVNYPSWTEIANPDHDRIVRALRARDPQEARAAMERHLRDSAEYAVRILEQHGFWGDGARDAETG